jgi:peroxiredoxin
MNFKSIVILGMSLIMPILSFSQTTDNKAFYTDTLNGLRIETKQDSLPPSMKMDGSIPIYDENGKKISGMEVIKAMQSGEGVPVRYINNNKEIKAYVLRPTTEEEKKKIKDKFKTADATKNEMVGKPAKPFTVKDIKGKTYSLKDLKGKIVVLNFWFVECMPCIKEMPELNSLVKKYKDKDVVFLGIADSDKLKITKFLKKTDFKYTIIPKEKNNKMIQDYNINSFPTHIVIDREGTVKHNFVGLNENTIDALSKMIDSLIK